MKKKLLLLIQLLTVLSATPFLYAEKLKSNRAVTCETRVIRQGAAESRREAAYLEKRAVHVRQALEKMLGRPIDPDTMPRIALIGSGGGYRAMLCTTGSLVGAQKIGLLDAVTYLAGTSGSCWSIGGWMCSDVSIESFRDHIIQRASSGKLYAITFTELKDIMWAMLSNRKVSTVNLYGTMLGNKLLDGIRSEKQQHKLSDQQKRIADGKRPFPIYTAVHEAGDGYHWYAFTPYEIGDINTGYYMPTELFGSSFENGGIKKQRPELPFPYLMGIFGSAFAGRIGVMYEKKIKAAVSNYRLRSALIKGLTKVLSNRQPFAAQVRNIMHRVNFDPISNKKRVALMDAGFSLNIPFPLFSGSPTQSTRAVDIIIVLDSSKTAHQADGLTKIVEFAQERGLKLPPIDLEAAQEKVITIFKDESDSTVPVIIYMPSLADSVYAEEKLEEEFEAYKPFVSNFSLYESASSGYAKTFNFKYEPYQAKQLTMITESNMLASADAITETINWVIDEKLQRGCHEA